MDRKIGTEANGIREERDCATLRREKKNHEGNRIGQEDCGRTMRNLKRDFAATRTFSNKWLLENAPRMEEKTEKELEKEENVCGDR